MGCPEVVPPTQGRTSRQRQRPRPSCRLRSSLGGQPRSWLLFDVSRNMRIAALLLLACAATTAFGASSQVEYSTDADVRALASVRLFAFDIVALAGRSQGEVALARILKREDKIRPLLEVYNRGTNEAKVYALAAFQHLAPPLFEQCRRDLVGKYNPLVRSMSGCLSADGTMLEFLIRIHQGHYEGYIRTLTKG